MSLIFCSFTCPFWKPCSLDPQEVRQFLPGSNRIRDILFEEEDEKLVAVEMLKPPLDGFHISTSV
jgi:hypothetical protein